MLQVGQWTARPTNDGGIHPGGGAEGTLGYVGGRWNSGWGVSTTPWGIVQPQFGQNSVPAGGNAPQRGQNAMAPLNYMPYFTVGSPLRSRCVALATLDAALYEELAGELRARHIPSVSVLPGERIPAQAAVVLTSPPEVPRIVHAHILPVKRDGDRTALWAAVEHALHPGNPTSELLIGIDPGPRPGYAVLTEDRCLAEGILESPEAAAQLGHHLGRRFPSRDLRFRVGSGDRLARDRVLNALVALHHPVELVDERGTTPRGHRRPRDAIAARAIARSRGRPVRGRTTLSVTAGEIANLQRLSREGSRGKFTIPRAEADRVLRGELTLPEALARGERRYMKGRGPPPSDSSEPS